MQELQDKRIIIDEIDKQIMDLLIKRFEVVQEVGTIKKANGLMITDLKREDIIKDKINNYPTSISYKQALQPIYETIINVSKDLQVKE